jgi:glycosyltransferase involved in cell wall biosynthesis
MTETRLAVGMDLSPLALTRAGTARYVSNLVAALEREDSLELRRYRFGGKGRAAKVVRDAVWYPAVLPYRAQHDRVDVLHCPSLRAPFRTSLPLVVTIHDLSPLRHPASFNAWNRRYSAFALPRIARAADAVIVGSEFARDEVVSVLGVEPARVRTIPYGVTPVFQPKGTAAGGEYVLAVSTLEPRKNFPRLLEAFERTSLNGAELRVVGAEGWGGVRVKGERVRWLGEISDDELARQYRGALCVAYVSLYEGVGLPVLEAMACGASVVTSAGPPFSEFAGGVAVEVDPYDRDSIAAGLEEAVGRREALGRLGPARAAPFDWARAAQQTLDVYREVAGSRTREGQSPPRDSPR